MWTVSGHGSNSQEVWLLYTLLFCSKLTLVTYVYLLLVGIDGTRVPFTEISLAPAEFDDYQIGVDASVTFCLKELRVRSLLCGVHVCMWEAIHV